MEFILTYIAIGFLTVFGWNSGQKVWDKYIEPEVQQIEAVKNDTATKSK
jgi:hypothetical protein